MVKYTAKQLNMVAWTLSAAVVVVAVIAWGQGNHWHFKSNYQLFPLFGLLAFSLMWSHYIAAVKRMYSGIAKKELHNYFETTSLAVLALILLHPGLLAWQLWKDGQGLPPVSELHYVAPALKGSVILGMTAWLVFLAYEFHRKFGERSWWKYVSLASDVGMIFIFVHSLRLGSQLQHGWFRYVWFGYGLSLLGCLVYIHMPKPKALLQKS